MEALYAHSPSARPGKSPLAASSDERGFTLVEAMVAMMVATIGLVSLASLLAVTIRMQQLGRNSTQAVRLAQDKIDELTTLNFATSAAVSCGGSITANVANHNDTPTSVAGYTRRWVVSAGPDADLKLRQVTVRVTPNVGDRRVASPFDLTTIIRGVSSPCP